MATAITNISVGSKTIDPYHVSVQQRTDSHHQFEIAVSSEKIEGENSFSIDKSISYIGEPIEITIQSGENTFNFKGIITTVNLDRTHAGDSLVILSGYSPTYMLEDGVGIKSYSGKTIAAIVQEILDQYPVNLLNPIIDPKYKKVIPYIVRYKETNYQFLRRLATTYGEWFYYDGRSVIFGKLPNPDNIELTLGKDLNSFDYGASMRPYKSTEIFYDYKTNRTLEKSTANFKPIGLDKYGKKALSAADNIFPNQPVNTVRNDTQDDAHLKHLVEVQKAAVISNITFFNGQSQNPGITVGSRIGATATKKVGNKNISDLIGRFRILSVNHQVSSDKNYTNSFKSMPVALSAPPSAGGGGTHNKMKNYPSNLTKSTGAFSPYGDETDAPSPSDDTTPDPRPEPAPTIAVVMDNNDPECLGRVRVQFKWHKEGEMSLWIRQVTLYAGLERGVYFVPEIGDEVYVDFEDNDTKRPYMLGAVYSQETAPEFFDADNNIKSIKTRGGHLIKFSDEEEAESITITDKNGNHIIINTAENCINVNAGADITVNAGGNMTFEAGGNMKFEAGGNVNWGVCGSIKRNVGVSVATKAGASFEVIAASKAHIIGQGNVLLNSGASVLFLLPPGIANMAAIISAGVTSGIYTPVIGGLATQILGGKIVKVNGAEVAVNS